MAKPQSILFLTLRVFSATGGIEKVCRVAGKALEEISEDDKSSLTVFSMYDNTKQIIEKYFSASIFKGFDQDKSKFVYQGVKAGIGKDFVLLSHINLLSVGVLIKIFSPKTKLFLIAHGIEVWMPLTNLKKWMLKKCDRILSVSDFTKESLVTLNGIHPNKIDILNNCLDPFLPEYIGQEKDASLLNRYGLNQSNKIILTLTRISEKEKYKGYDHVLYAVKHLKELYPSLRYLIVGKYDANEKNRIDTIIESLGIKDYVVFTGFIPDEEIAAHFKLADVYVMPSKKEGFGIVFIEAMYYGIPVIAGNKDGSVDALAKGELGLLVNPDDKEEITNAIRKVLENQNQFKPDHIKLMNKFSFPVYKKNIQEKLLTP